MAHAQVFYPPLLALNEIFAKTPFAERVAADGSGFYRAVDAALHERGRPHAQAAAEAGGPCFPTFG